MIIARNGWAAAGAAALLAVVAGCGGTSRPAPVAPSSAGAPTARVSGAAGPSDAGAAVLTSTGSSADAPSITASGEGRASGPPDLLTVTLGVQASGETARAALSKNNDEATALIDRVEADGVAAADVQTSQLSLEPVYADGSSGEPPRITGYSVTDMVSVKIHQLDRAGAILDDAVTAGGTDSQIQSMGYSVSDAGPLLAAAHAEAVQEAVADAKAMASAAGVTLGALRVITDTGTQVPVPTPIAAAAGAMASAPAVPVQPGAEDVTAQVTVTYDVS